MFLSLPFPFPLEVNHCPKSFKQLPKTGWLRRNSDYCLMMCMQLEYWKTEEEDPVVKEHRIIYVDSSSTPYCRPSTATRQVRAVRTPKHRKGPERPKSHGRNHNHNKHKLITNISLLTPSTK